VIHLAFANDFSSAEALARAVAEEGAALATLGEELIGSDRPLVTVSGTPYVPGRVSTEADPLQTDGPVGGRARSVTAVLGLASRGVRSTAVRMPRTVHNQGTGGFAGLLTGIARRTGVSGYPGDGAQRWPAVHALDAAVLFRLALEQAPAGTLLNAVADEGVPFREIAEVIGRHLAVPATSVAPAGARDQFGSLAGFAAINVPASSAVTRQRFGWQPAEPGLIADLDAPAGYYFADPAAAGRDATEEG
jgi:nucleoside-diphosphate-sugar epimerase